MDPHHVDADANPNSTYHSDGDPDCDFYFKRIRIRIVSWCGSESGLLVGADPNPDC